MSPILAKLRGRYAPLLLLGGAAAAGFVVVPHLPKERTVELRLDDARTVTGVDVAWSPVGASAEAVQGGAWHFAPGQAPAVIRTPVRLPDGRYALDVQVERSAEREDIHREITLGEAEHVTVRLR